jgi:DNA polymerase I
MRREFVYKPWVAQATPNENFPFSYTLNNTEEQQEDFSIDFFMGESLKEKITEALINNFNYIGKAKSSFVFLVNAYVINNKNKKEFKNKIYVIVNNIQLNYNYVLVESLEQLKNVLSINKPFKIAFDTETTGLNPEEDYIVGLSFSLNNTVGYYVPIKHDKQYEKQNLGKEALAIVYKAMTDADLVYMFNSRFDMRMMEYTDNAFDMSKIKARDVQVSTWFFDPDFRQHSLKYLEKHFLGFYRPDLFDTLKNSKINTFNTALIAPENLVFYAGQDTISTFALGEITNKFQEEFGLSGQIDQQLLYPLMKMENHGIRINTLYLAEQTDYILLRLAELNEELNKYIGNINLNSPKQKISLFESFGLNTDVKTKTGNMATGTKEVEDMIEKLESQGKKYPEWLKLLGERTKLEKLQSTFFGSLLEQAKINDDRVRINYRNTQAATGRLSSGADFSE